MSEPIFDRPPAAAEDAFVRFVNALHWAAGFGEVDLRLIMDADHGATADLLGQVLSRSERADHRLVAEFIAELTGGAYAFSEARAIWKRGWSDLSWSDWNDPAAFLRFLLIVRDAIDPHAWPASTPRFRPEPGGANPRKPGRRPR